MVEFKPALGWVFREYLEGYTHWAYGDLDVFMGDFTKGWLEPYEMREYDIVTYRYCIATPGGVLHFGSSLPPSARNGTGEGVTRSAMEKTRTLGE